MARRGTDLSPVEIIYHYILIDFHRAIYQNKMMCKAILIISMVVSLTFSIAAGQSEEYKYRIGATYGLGNLKAADIPYYGFNHTWGVAAGSRGSRHALTFSLQSQNNYSDVLASSHLSFFPDKDTAVRLFKSLRAGFDFDYRLKEHGKFHPIIGAGIGYLIWKYEDPVGDTVVHTVGNRGNTVNYKAAEMFLSAALGIETRISRRIAIGLKTSFDYLTGIGTDLSDSVSNNRDRMLMRLNLTFSYLFNFERGKKPVIKQWPSSDAWTEEEKPMKVKSSQPDSDGDGVADDDDDCPNTPEGVIIDDNGCSTDSDRDGVPDGLDDCPRTPRSATGYVDIFGCPIDADFDGVPDYRDSCRAGPVGAGVDETGCPLDSDGDGVYDGLDDCPATKQGIEVDQRGCIDVAFLHDVMRVYVDYPSGSFEIDQRTRKRLQPLIKKLLILSDVRITINGYTDNVGPTEANRDLSQKRANRMRDWMIENGITGERLTATGKGKTNFIASNKTAKGRAKNRRIELIFTQ
jgi:outer membrane protein OmpA-like peptidoglycan-associated protein